jgi:hypothetical protein
MEGVLNDCCTSAVIAACSVDHERIADLTAQLASSQPEPVKVARAERDDAIKTVKALLAILKRDGGFRTPTQQATMRGAEAMLAEMGQSIGSP